MLQGGPQSIAVLRDRLAKQAPLRAGLYAIFLGSTSELPATVQVGDTTMPPPMLCRIILNGYEFCG